MEIEYIYYMAYATRQNALYLGRRCQRFPPRKMAQQWNFSTRIAGLRIYLEKEFAYRQMKIILMALLPLQLS
ncbi:hypothetical protein TorRG33x02_295230 [Trema orientale]|uniref:Uncharacterized protein n=1 Tax=Trema orientale TaxID=63057 RepID=A0A2P5C6R1_TREOI|nr:hypothetical protein TorRG33x02_295230 [Trema orientale]